MKLRFERNLIQLTSLLVKPTKLSPNCNDKMRAGVEAKTKNDVRLITKYEFYVTFREA